MNSFSKSISQKLNKLSPAQIEKIYNSLSAERDMLSSIIESISTGLIILDRNCRLVLINKAAERNIPFSLRPEENHDESVKLWDLVGDSEIAAFLKDCFENNKSNVSGEFTFSTGGGSVRFVQLTVTPLLQQNELSGSIITARDITGQRNQEILLHRMESLAGLTNLAASVAHEIKNPLGAISIHIQLLQKAVKLAREGDGKLPDEKFVEKYLDVINEEIENLNKIVMDFLFAVRPVRAAPELVQVNPLLKKFVEFLLPEFNGKNIQVRAELSDDGPRLLLDPKLFREVIMNLAQNALFAIEEKFSGKEGGLFEITGSVKNDSFIIGIKDNGAGMSEKTLAHIFEPYYTTKASGTGLGLTMVYKIVKEFSGDIQVTSKEGGGTAFIITLPLPQTDKRLLTVCPEVKQ